MAKEWAKAFYNGKRYRKCRESYISLRISIDGGICEECRQQLGYIVHHTIILTESNINDPEISLNHEYMKYVCKDCHDTYEGHGIGGHGKIKPICVFDETGQPISMREIDRSVRKI